MYNGNVYFGGGGVSTNIIFKKVAQRKNSLMQKGRDNMINGDVKGEDTETLNHFDEHTRYQFTFLLVVALELMIFCVGCARFEVSDSGEPLLYDVCDETMLPDELVTIIDKKKENPFNLVYSNSTYTYIVIAAGMQERDDVGVTLEEMYKDDNAIYIKGVLRQVATPTDGVKGDNVSFPYMVVRIVKMDLPVVFK